MMESTFEERLAVTLTLTIAGKAHKVIAGSIKRFALDLWSWGLEGEVEFLLTDNSHAGARRRIPCWPTSSSRTWSRCRSR
jgi:hypothetical protein